MVTAQPNPRSTAAATTTAAISPGIHPLVSSCKFGGRRRVYLAPLFWISRHSNLGRRFFDANVVQAAQESDKRTRIVDREDAADLELLQSRGHDLDRLRSVPIEFSRYFVQGLVIEHDLPM